MLAFELARRGMTHADLDDAIHSFRSMLRTDARDLFPLGAP